MKKISSNQKPGLKDYARLGLSILRGFFGDFKGLAVEALRFRKVILTIILGIIGIIIYLVIVIVSPLQTLQINLNDVNFQTEIADAQNNKVLIETEKEKVWQEFLAWLKSLTKEGENPVTVNGKINYEEVLIIYQVLYADVKTGAVNQSQINKIARTFVEKDGLFSTRIKEFDEVLVDLHANTEETNMAMMLYNAYNDSFTTDAILGAIDESHVGAWQGSGSLGWPLPSYTRISSTYGYRVHPTKGIYKLHTGVDIPAHGGVAILAANDGVVVQAKMAGDWGNCVIIDHGNGFQTLYAHQSKIKVSFGQQVAKGDIIGYVGTTGASTGNHLHFEVRINGKSANPMEFINQ